MECEAMEAIGEAITWLIVMTIAILLALLIDKVTYGKKGWWN